MDSLSAKICHAVCGRMTGTEFVFAVPGERHAADAIIRKLFYAGDVTGKRGAVFDGQKGCGFAGIPRSLHIGSGVAGSDAVTEFLHLPVEVIPVRLIVIDRGLPAVFVRNEYRVELCPVDIGRDRG